MCKIRHPDLYLKNTQSLINKKGCLMKDKTNNTSLCFKGQDFFIGLDVHLKNWKTTIRNNNMELKTFSMNPIPVELYRYMNKNYPDGNYCSVYEAGFSGYWTHRELQSFGFKNIIVNPADVPTTHKEKDQKRDAIDSRKLARELESGSLSGIYIPTPQQQSFRTISRLYKTIIKDRTRLKNRIKSFLHFHGIDIPQRNDINHWSGRFIHWLKNQNFNIENNQYNLDYLLDCLEEKRKETLSIVKYMKHISKDNHIIRHLKSVTGIGFITAFVYYAELIDMRRFKNIDCLASYIGLIPSVSSSADREINRGLTNRQNKHLRDMIIESSWIAVRNDPALTQSYNQYTQRMSKQKAIVRRPRNN